MEDQWIVNKGGIVHSIPADMEPPAGSHPASPAELAEWERVEAAKAAVFIETERVRREEHAARRARGWG